MNSAEWRGNKVVATAAKSTRRNRRSYTIRTGNKPTSNRRRKKQEKLPRGVRKIAQQEQRAKRAEANGKSNETTTNLSRLYRLKWTPKAMEKNKHTNSKSGRHAGHVAAPITGCRVS